MDSLPTLEIEVVYALPECQHSIFLALPEGTTVQGALDLAALQSPFSELDLAQHAVGIYAEVVTNRQRVLQLDDRLEIYRPLQVDPMQQRHARAKVQAEKKPQVV